jgi:hypothetical protein
MHFRQWKRRDFITLLGGAAAAWPLAAQAQSDRVRRIGVLMGYPESDSEAQTKIAAFRDGLQKLGWTEGRTTRLDTRWATPADAKSIERFAKELVALQPDLILSSTTPTTAALLQHTRTIPIVFGTVADPVGSGFVASFPRPGGNVTGFVVFYFSPVGLVVEHIRERKLVALAVNSPRRAAILPEVPTLAEAGVADAEYPLWYGLFGPARTPRHIVETLHRETLKALKTPNVEDKLATLGLEPMVMTPAEFDAHVKAEVRTNAALISAARIK